MSLISCKNVCMSYSNFNVVRDVSFDIFEGDYLSILGENGSGKTTLINGILKTMSLSSGDIIFNNIKSNEIGYLPQQTQVQRDFPASVFEVVLSGCLNSRGLRPFYSKKEKQIAKDNMKLFKIDNIADKSYRSLSGGQQQRVLLARALSASKKLIILDEPVTGLDPVVTKEFYSIIKDINKNYGVTVVIISHDVYSAVKYSNKILHMKGNIKFFGTTKEYIETTLYKNLIGGENND